MTPSEVQMLEEEDPRKSAMEEGELIEIGNKKTTRVISEMEPGMKASLVACLQKNMAIFAIDVQDLTKIVM